MSIGAGKSVTIVGAGLAGSLLACYLARLGFRVGVYERRPDPRRAGYSGGRSINLALSARGLWGLEGVGLDKAVLEHALPMKGRIMHPEDQHKPTYFQPYSKDPADSIKSISRGGLNLLLLNAAAEYDNVSLAFNQRCVDIDLDRNAASFQDDSRPDSPGPITTIEGDLIIGADGAFSAVRARLQKTDRFDYSQHFLTHGYKELHIPPLPPDSLDFGRWGGFALDPGALHIWPRGQAMMIALPNLDKSFTCTLFWPFEGEHGLASLRTPADVSAFFARHYPDALALMPTLADDYFANPTGSLVTVRCWPWVHTSPPPHRGSVALIGDAAHAIVPFFGQGMNAAFEDVRILADILRRRAAASADPQGRWLPGALDEYQRSRKPNTDAIARMALDNFVEMRDKVASRLFLQRKRLEHFLHDLLPLWFTPKYNLVSFSTVPYTEALRRGSRIDRFLRILVLVAALLLAAALLALHIPSWLLMSAILIGAWIAWDRRSYRRDTAT